jgi:hypothetical protein
MYQVSESLAAEDPVTYGVALSICRCRRATYVHKILKGVEPASRAADKIRVRHQSECGEANRPEHSAQRVGRSGQSNADRVIK